MQPGILADDHRTVSLIHTTGIVRTKPLQIPAFWTIRTVRTIFSASYRRVNHESSRHQAFDDISGRSTATRK
jgi:hypothetical protein